MNIHRVISTTARLFVMALALSVPAGASANSLLSGYGGPGQGNQAILGSALINGPSSGGGSNGSSGAGSSATAAGGTGAGEPSAAPGAAPGKASTQRSHGRSGASKGRTHASGTSVGAVHAYTSPTATLTPPVAVGGSPALGLSDTDLLYILLALGVLVATGLLTRQAARRPG